jgi:di/tricarboxylate transporter
MIRPSSSSFCPSSCLFAVKRLSRLGVTLMPAAYCSLLGGQWTLIGTRSNIVISDYLLEHTGAGLGFFDFTAVAAVVFVVCATYFLSVGRKFLPKTCEINRLENSLATQYLTEATVMPQSAELGKKLGDLSWAWRADTVVLEIIRLNQRMPPNPPLRLQAGDVLVVQGPASRVRQLLKSPDFELQQESAIAEDTLRSADLVTLQAILSPASDYKGQTLEELNFPHEFGFTVVGLARRGTPVQERPTATALRFGDALLLGHVSGGPRVKRNIQRLAFSQSIAFNAELSQRVVWASPTGDNSDTRKRK